MPLSLWGLGRLALARLAAPGAGHLILTVTNSGGNALFTTAAPHGLTVTRSITLSGNSVPDYDGQKTVATVPTPTTFTDGAGYANDSTGGRWD